MSLFLSDLVQACAIVVYLGTTLYDSTAFRSSYGLEQKDQEDDQAPKRKSFNKWAMRGAVLGAGAGAGAGAAA